jgi:nicotinamidase-related amidase
MTERIWDPFLTARDRAHLEIEPRTAKGVGSRPVLLMVDLYRWAFGDEPEELLDAVRTWPGSCGLAGWRALPSIQRLLATAREHGVPVIHLAGLESLLRDDSPGTPGAPTDPVVAARRARKYDIVDEVRPLASEVVIRKTAASAFFATPLVQMLNHLRADTIIVAGESTSGCVRATVVDGRSYQYRVVVPEECVFDRSEAAHAINLFDIDRKYADVLPVDEVCAYLATIGAARGAG